MKKKIISVVLVMTMVFALLAVSASARGTAITSVALTVKTLTAATVPSTDLAGAATVDATANYTVKGIQLLETGVSGSDVSNQTTALTKGVEYMLVVQIEAKNGYYFPNKTSSMYSYLKALDGCTVTPETTGSEIYVTTAGGDAPTSTEDGVCITWRYSFTADDPEPTEIDTIEINGVSSLAIGNKIKDKLSVPQDAGYEITAATIDDNLGDQKDPVDTVAAGTWTLQLHLKVKDGYKFAKNGSDNTDSQFAGTVKLDNVATTPATEMITDFSDAPMYNKATEVYLTFSNISFEASSGDDPSGDNPSGDNPSGDDPSGGDPDSDFDGLFGRLFGFIRWKKFTDDIKTVSILTIIFKILEEIAARIARFFKR